MKFSSGDARYKSERKKFSEQIGPVELWSVIDHWPLYAGISNMARWFAIADLLRETIDVPGDIAEFGSWQGANLMFLTKLMRLWDPNANKHVHCFDTFEGLTAFDERDGNQDTWRGQYRGDFEKLSSLLALYELEEVVVHRGLIEETLAPLLGKRPELSFSFVYCDTDLHASTAEILAQVPGRLSKGGLIVFDEWNHEAFPGETVAVREFLAQHGDDYEVRHIQNTRQPSLSLKKIRD